jgi:hypothetical protein
LAIAVFRLAAMLVVGVIPPPGVKFSQLQPDAPNDVVNETPLPGVLVTDKEYAGGEPAPGV